MQLTQGELKIRNATPDDAPLLCEWWNNGKVMAHAGFPNGLGITVKEIREKIEAESDETIRRHIIELADRPIGEMNYRNEGSSTAAIGIKICDFQQQDKGLGTVLLTMFIDGLFDALGYERIVLDTNVKNKRAQHVYEKLGFRLLGVRRNAGRNQLGELQSYMDYELRKADWKISRRTLID